MRRSTLLLGLIASVAVIVLVACTSDTAVTNPTASTTSRVNPTTITGHPLPPLPAIDPNEPPGNQPPSSEIVYPANLVSYQASFDPETRSFGADIAFVVEATDPNNDPLTFEWYSSDEGFLGAGTDLIATIHTVGSDSSQPFITVRVTDRWGRVSESQIQVIVWIPSGT